MGLTCIADVTRDRPLLCMCVGSPLGVIRVSSSAFGAIADMHS